MGVYGSRWLAAQGYLGRLNIFVEPTDGFWFDRSTTSMTAEVVFAGDGSTDDFPEQGHNSTVALGYLAAGMASALSEQLNHLGVKMTVAGLHTGTQHNRVYGEGRLLFNFAYSDIKQAHIARGLIETAFASVSARFTKKFNDLTPFCLTALDLKKLCHFGWLKYGLPVLNNRNPKLEAMLAGCGLRRNIDLTQAFTCDAMWGQGDGLYSVVLGPGSLSRNGAHTDREAVSSAELEAFCAVTVRLLTAFTDLD
jgi:acetylornithine deacetylase